MLPRSERLPSATVYHIRLCVLPGVGPARALCQLETISPPPATRLSRDYCMVVKLPCRWVLSRVNHDSHLRREAPRGCPGRSVSIFPVQVWRSSISAAPAIAWARNRNTTLGKRVHIRRLSGSYVPILCSATSTFPGELMWLIPSFIKLQKEALKSGPAASFFLVGKASPCSDRCEILAFQEQKHWEKMAKLYLESSPCHSLNILGKTGRIILGGRCLQVRSNSKIFFFFVSVLDQLAFMIRAFHDRDRKKRKRTQIPGCHGPLANLQAAALQVGTRCNFVPFSPRRNPSSDCMVTSKVSIWNVTVQLNVRCDRCDKGARICCCVYMLEFVCEATKLALWLRYYVPQPTGAAAHRGIGTAQCRSPIPSTDSALSVAYSSACRDRGHRVASG